MTSYAKSPKRIADRSDIGVLLLRIGAAGVLRMKETKNAGDIAGEGFEPSTDGI